MQRLYRTTSLAKKNLQVTRGYVTQYQDNTRSLDGKNASYNQNPCTKEGIIEAADTSLPYRYILSFDKGKFPLTSALFTSPWEEQQKNMINLEKYAGKTVEVFGHFPDAEGSSGNSFICGAAIKPVSHVEYTVRVTGGSIFL